MNTSQSPKVHEEICILIFNKVFLPSSVFVGFRCWVVGFFAGAWGGVFCLGFGGLGFFLRREDGEMGEEKRR